MNGMPGLDLLYQALRSWYEVRDADHKCSCQYDNRLTMGCVRCLMRGPLTLFGWLGMGEANRDPVA